MAHFAQLDENNTVIQVIAVNNDVFADLPFPESEQPGVVFCQSLLGADTKWIQTSYNAKFRYNYAGIGFTFDSMPQPYGAFISPKPYPSWVLNTTIYQWEAPIPYPDDEQRYIWNEDTTSWILFE